jgi:transposase
MANIRELKKENQKLKKENQELKKIIISLNKKIEDLESKFEKVIKELNKYKNSNTPSSSNKHIKPNIQNNNKDKKRGAPKGHKGTTRIQSATIKEVVDCNECPNCHSNNLKDLKIFNRTIEETPKEVIPQTKTFEIHKKKCKNCGLKFIPPQNTTPLIGKFGINLMVMIIFIRFILRGVLRKTSMFLNEGIMFKITPASINSIINRVANAADKEYYLLKIRIRNSNIIYVDETSFSVLGKNQWVWVFRTANDILLVIRPSRGNNVLEEILGKKYSGTVICDCWRAYNYLSNANLQRCWAHLLRKSKLLCKSLEGNHFHKTLQTLFKEIKLFNNTYPTLIERKNKYIELTNKLEKIVNYYGQYEEFKCVTKYINFNLKNWFTCIKIEGIEPTNNFAEQAIRETVMVRKIIGAFRSEKGKHNYETLASLIASWQMQNFNLKEKLKEMLKTNLCFS